MRTFLLVCLVGLVVAVGMAFAVGLVEIATDHVGGKYVTTVTMNTTLIHSPYNPFYRATQESTELAGQNAMDANGKITAVRADKDEFDVSENIKNWTFRLADHGKVFVNGRESKFGDLRPGDDVTVTFDREGSQMVASVVRATRE